MGFTDLYKEKLLAQKLRKKGYSYKEILRHMTVSKDTLSRWCRDIPLTLVQQKKLLEKKRLGQRKGSLIAAENKRRERLYRTKQLHNEAKRELGRLKDREKFIAGVALYAAEGDKTDGKGGFANSDPKLIKFMSEWLVKYAKISPARLRGAIWLHEGLDEMKAKKFWSSLTNIPLNQFHKTYIAKVKNDSKKIRKNLHEFGVFSIIFSDTEKHRKIMGWIYALFNVKI